jgi:hypothetical protein
MKQVLLTGAAMLMSMSLAAFAETTPAQGDGAAMSPLNNPAPHQMARPMDQSANAPVESKTRSSVTTTESRTAGNAAMGSDAMFASVPASQELSSKVVGLDVYNSANKNIGKIKDIAFDQNGVTAYIVAVGGFLGMGDHYVAVSPSAVNLTFDASAKKWHAAMNTDVDQLKAAPEYKYSSND